jgi:TctA family transporter
VLSVGDHSTFVRDPISAALLGFAAVFIIGSLLRHVIPNRRAAATT